MEEKIIVDEVCKKVSTKYGLICLTAKRAHEILAGSEKFMKAGEVINKVFKEIIQDKITIKREETDESKPKESK